MRVNVYNTTFVILVGTFQYIYGVLYTCTLVAGNLRIMNFPVHRLIFAWAGGNKDFQEYLRYWNDKFLFPPFVVQVSKTNRVNKNTMKISGGEYIFIYYNIIIFAL